jgi:sarcosine oxidase delta subunit
MNLKEKVKAMALYAWNDLRHATDHAIKTNEYKDFEEAYKHVRDCERLLRAVRAQIRTHMRKTKTAMQEACPHPTKNDVSMSHNPQTGERTVYEQACTVCGKHFTLKERTA